MAGLWRFKEFASRMASEVERTSQSPRLHQPISTRGDSRSRLSLRTDQSPDL
jgi:hypothetical protein